MSIDITDLDVLPQTDPIALADLAHVGLSTCKPLSCMLFTFIGTTTID